MDKLGKTFAYIPGKIKKLRIRIWLNTFFCIIFASVYALCPQPCYVFQECK